MSIDYVGENSLTQLITEIKGKIPTDIPKRWYGECTTAQNTQQKVVTIDGFTSSDLVKGAVVTVKFSQNAYASGYNSLNVSGTGAKTIYKRGTTSSMGAWLSGAVITFVYDGNYWIMADYQENTDANVKQTLNNNTNAYYPVLFKGDTTTQEKTQGTLFSPKVTINPSTGTIASKVAARPLSLVSSPLPIIGYNTDASSLDDTNLNYVNGATIRPSDGMLSATAFSGDGSNLTNIPSDDSKQDALSDTQLNACNSGITADKVATYDGYDSRISTLEGNAVIKYKDYIVPVVSGIANIVAVSTHNNMITIVPRGAVKTSAYIFYENVNGVPTWSARVIDPTTGNNVANRNQTFRVFYL